MCCDGVFDQLNNDEIIQSLWLTTKHPIKAKSIHEQCSVGVDMIIKTSMIRKTFDNVTCVMIAFTNFENLFKSNNKTSENLKTEKNQIKENNFVSFKNTELKVLQQKSHQIKSELYNSNTCSQPTINNPGVIGKNDSNKKDNVYNQIIKKKFHKKLTSLDISSSNSVMHDHYILNTNERKENEIHQPMTTKNPILKNKENTFVGFKNFTLYK